MSQIERIGGLKALRAEQEAQLITDQMQEEQRLHDELAAEADMTASQLSDKYSHWKNHWVWRHGDWVHEVVDNNTRLGYWEWVLYKLNE
jgi:hypothetical protein